LADALIWKKFHISSWQFAKPDIRVSEFNGRFARGPEWWFDGRENFVPRKLISATELAEFVYCAKAWELKYIQGAEPSSAT
jgi:hypothetical protein